LLLSYHAVVDLAEFTFYNEKFSIKMYEALQKCATHYEKGYEVITSGNIFNNHRISPTKLNKKLTSHIFDVTTGCITVMLVVVDRRSFRDEEFNSQTLRSIPLKNISVRNQIMQKRELLLKKCLEKHKK
jgi:hypothetical protein